jgi:hypothetical protein
MCNACLNVCCGSDQFEKCGCDGCDCEDCWSEDDLDTEIDFYDEDCVTPQDCTPPELKAVLAEALARTKT